MKAQEKLIAFLTKTDKGMKILMKVAEREFQKVNELFEKSFNIVLNDKDSQKTSARILVRLASIENLPIMKLNNVFREIFEQDLPISEDYCSSLFAAATNMVLCDNTKARQVAKYIYSPTFLREVAIELPKGSLETLGGLYVAIIEVSREEAVKDMTTFDKQRVFFLPADKYYEGLFNSLLSLSVFYENNPRKSERVDALIKSVCNAISNIFKARILDFDNPELSKTLYSHIIVNKKARENLLSVVLSPENRQQFLVTLGKENIDSLIETITEGKDYRSAFKILKFYNEFDIPFTKTETLEKLYSYAENINDKKAKEILLKAQRIRENKNSNNKRKLIKALLRRKKDNEKGIDLSVQVIEIDDAAIEKDPSP